MTRSDALESSRRAYTRLDLHEALRASLAHLERRPWSREASLIAALSLSRLDFPDEAEPYYRRAGRLSLEDSHHRVLGLMRANQREQAVQAYEEILATWPDNILALSRIAFVRLTQKNNAEALKIADRLIKLPKGTAIGYTLRGVVQHNDQDREAAVTAFEHVLELDPELKLMPLPRALFWNHLANDLVGIGRVDDARRYLAQAVAADPNADNSDLMVSLGLAHEWAGAADEAEACFRQVAEWKPNSAAPSLCLGKIALRRGKAEEALKYLLRAQELSPRDYETMYHLSLAYRQLGRRDEAEHLAKRAARFRDKSAASVMTGKAPLPRYAL